VPRDDIPKRRPERSEGCLATLGTSGWRGITGCRDFSLRSKRQKRAGTPSRFFSHPEAQAEESPIVKEEISRYARNDKMSRRCLAIARQDKRDVVGRTKKDARQDKVGDCYETASVTMLTGIKIGLY
jgi:hypothetical protein